MTRQQNINHLSNSLATIRAKLDMACIDSHNLELTQITDRLASAFNDVILADDVLNDYINRNATDFTPLRVPAISGNLLEAL